MEERTLRKPNIVKRNLSLIVAFFVPILLLCIVYLMREIYPFGDEMFLRSDMYHQYAPFLKLFQSILKDGGSLGYSWNVGLGSNFLSTYAYYLASPLNWIVAILPSDHIPEIMSGFIILKSGLMSATFAYYLNQKFENRMVLSAGFGIFYAMSGYMAAYCWNVMWLDCLVLLPLMMLGMERMVKEGKCLLYTVCFALSVISNYYIAIMLCIWSLLYFIYLMAAEAKLSGAADVFRRTGRYLLYSFLGGCIGAVVFLPALLTLFSTASADSSFPTLLNAYFNLLEMFAHGMMNTEITMLEGYIPNIYCGVAAFALVPLYWLNRRIPFRERAGKTILLGILAFSFAFNVPAFIWHGFHFPNSLPARHSFLYIFLVLLMGYEAALRIRRVNRRAVLICAGIAIAAVFALQVLYDGEAYPVSVAYASAGFLAAYAIVFLFLQNKKKLIRMAALWILMIIFVAEALINTDQTGYGTTGRESYVSDNEAIEEVLARIPEEDLYRVEKRRRRTKNDGAWSGYRSASIFSSVTTKGISDFYTAFGLQSGTNAYSYYGNTPVSSALLGVRYQLSDRPEDDPLLMPFTSSDGVYLYENKYWLPLGFMVKETTQAEVNLRGQNPFDVQNDFLDAAKSLAPVFSVGEKMEGKEIRYTAKEDGRLFFYVGQKLKDMTITAVNGADAGQSNSFTSLECAMIVDAGEVKAGQELRLSTSDENIASFSVIPATMQEDALMQAIQALKGESLLISNFTDDCVQGTVHVKEKGMLFTSIPYDKGWTVLVDGEKEEIHDFYGAFIQVPLSEGTHKVEFRYQVPGFLPGLITSLCALAVLVLLTVFTGRRKIRKVEAPLPEESAES